MGCVYSVITYGDDVHTSVPPEPVEGTGSLAQ
jgi:hypothetical protein